MKKTSLKRGVYIGIYVLYSISLLTVRKIQTTPSLLLHVHLFCVSDSIAKASRRLGLGNLIKQQSAVLGYRRMLKFVA